jgi:hypothetical protein
MALRPFWINKNLIGIITGYNQPDISQVIYGISSICTINAR